MADRDRGELGRTAAASECYDIEGLTCPDCAARIQAAVQRMDGVQDCLVDHNTGTMVVHLRTLEPPTAQLAQIVEKTGHRLVVPDREKLASQVDRVRSPMAGFLRFVLSRRETRLTAIAAVLTLLGLGLAWLL